MEATHKLESRGQESSAESKSSSPQRPLTFWTAKDSGHQQGQNPAHHGSHSLAGEQRTAVVSRNQIQLTTEATHPLESRGQLSSAGTKSSSPQKPLTGWRAEDSHHQQGPIQIQLTTDATHELESQGQAWSAGSKSSSPRKPLTLWRAKDICRQQGQNPAWSAATYDLETRAHT